MAGRLVVSILLVPQARTLTLLIDPLMEKFWRLLTILVLLNFLSSQQLELVTKNTMAIAHK
jgi:hypothetical protein